MIKLEPICLIYPIFYLISEYFEYIPGVDKLSIMYCEGFKRYFKYNFSDLNVEPNKQKKNIFLLGPHGMFVTSLTAFCVFRSTPEERKTTKLFTSPMVTSNPILTMFSKMISGNRLEDLTNRNVIKNLKEYKYNFSVSVGGFEEVNLFGTKNVIYNERWSYWIHNAIKHGYDITFCYLQGGSQDYKSLLGSWGLDFRLKLAHFYIPFNIIYGRYLILPFNDVPFTEVLYHMKLPHNPNMSRKEAQVYIDKFKTDVHKLISESIPKDGQHEFAIFDKYGEYN